MRTPAAVVTLALALGCSSGASVLRDYARALDAQRRGQDTEARRLYAQILAERPEVEGVHSNLALLDRAQGQLDAALVEVRRERAAHPQLWSSRVNEVIFVLERDGRDAARPLAEALVAAEAPKLADPLAYLVLGAALRGPKGDPARAVAALDEAVLHGAGTVKLTAQLERAYARAQQGDALGAAEDFAAVSAQRPDAIASYDEALLRLSLGDLDAAQRATDRAEALDPEAAPVRRLSAIVAARLGDHEAAVAALTALLESAPGDQDALWRRALSHLERKEHAAAQADLERAAALPGAPPALHFDLGVVRLAAGQLEAARDAFAAASTLPAGARNREALDRILARR